MKNIRGLCITRKILGLIVLVLFLECLPGCSWFKGSKPPEKERVSFNIKAEQSCNDGHPVYLLVRKVNQNTFLFEEYDEIAGMVYAEPQDESVLILKIFLPGQEEEIAIVKPEDTDIGIYVLYSKPGENWKMRLNQPLEPEYALKLKDNYLEEMP